MSQPEQRTALINEISKTGFDVATLSIMRDFALITIACSIINNDPTPVTPQAALGPAWKKIYTDAELAQMTLSEMQYILSVEVSRRAREPPGLFHSITGAALLKLVGAFPVDVPETAVEALGSSGMADFTDAELQTMTEKQMRDALISTIASIGLFTSAELSQMTNNQIIRITASHTANDVPPQSSAIAFRGRVS